MANTKPKATSKIKKAALMAGISAMSMMPLKSSAQSQTPVRDKKQNTVEITVNPDQLRDEIRQLQRDSANVAVYSKFSADYIDRWLQQKRKEVERVDALQHLSTYILNNKELSSDQELLLLLENLISAEVEGRKTNGNLEAVALELIQTGITVDSGESIEEINAKLAQGRALLNMLEQQQGK